ncbi:MAG: hypothetical protein IH876_13305 [Gemmatimonadetes bacterium]|nr:hypothetical protein [Gemmatimonadota bacterium]
MAKMTKRERAQAFADQMAGVLGDNLKSLIMFGSEVRGGYDPSHSNLNLLLIVADASTAALRPIEKAIAGWVKRREPPPLIFSETEWRNSTDVFPIEIEDMREAHELLRGMDPFDGIETDLGHLRHELEREIRGKLLQLRAEYAAVAGDGKALTRLLIDSAGTFFVLMRATVRLVGGKPETAPASLVRQATEAAGLDAQAFSWVVDKITGRTVRALKPYDDIGARYVDELQRLAHFVDQYGQTEPADTTSVATATDESAGQQ